MVSILTILVCVLALLNAYFHLYTVSSYEANQQGLSSSYLVAGYVGMFLTILISPIPDYILLPVYGYLSSIGGFNPFTVFLVCLVAAIFPIEFVCGRLAARSLVLKALSFMRITEKDLKVADNWLETHGNFSIFITTFIPFFYSISALAAGTLKMNPVLFIVSSTVGFGLRFAFLEYIGYYGIYIFTASFDYAQRSLFFLVLITSSVYLVIYFVNTLRYTRRMFPIL